MNTNILVFGKNGQVARALKKVLPPETPFLGHEEAHFEKPKSLEVILNQYQPKIIINTAAYTAVDKAETEKELCFTVNAEAPSEISKWCSTHNALLVHFSTDYVYGSCTGTEPLLEESPKTPVNYYGVSKQAAEEFIRASGARHIILRTSWIYDAQGINFVRTMLRLGAEREELKVVNDQIGAPTFAKDLAGAVVKILDQHPGNIKQTYNICSGGFVSWFDFAQEIFRQSAELGRQLKVRSVLPISTAEYKTAAQRPLNSRMNQEKLKKDFGIALPPWQSSLKECLNEMRNI